MKISSKSLVAGLLASFTFCSAQALAEELRLSVAKSAQENLFSKVAGPFEKESGIKLVFAPMKERSKVTDYFEDVIAGRAEAAAASQTYDVWLKSMKEAKITVPSNVTQRVIGRDIMTLVSNKGTGVAKLSLEQVKDILLGQIKSWKQVGGADLPITIVTYNDKPTKNLAIQKLLLDDKSFGNNVKAVSGEEPAIVAAVSSTPGAIGFLTLDVPTPNATVLETPPIGRPITLLNLGEPSPKLQKLISFLRAYSAKAR